MAVTAVATINTNAGEIPSGYTPPTLPVITPIEEGTYVVDISISNADASDPVVGIGNVVTAVQTDFVSTQAGNFKLNEALTINVNCTITNIVRTNTESSIYVTGTEVFRCTVYYEYQ